MVWSATKLFVAGMLLAACQTSGSSNYPLGRVGDVLTVEYGNGLPMTIYLPPGPSGPVPVVVYHHGRAFKGWRDGKLSLSPQGVAVTQLNNAGVAIAVPVRQGYYSTGGPDGERIPCNNPSRSDFQSAAASAKRDVLASIQRVRSMPELDKDRVVLAGFSAGGFAAAAALPDVDAAVVGSVILGGGGRCGKRPPLLGGFAFADEIVREASAASIKPLIFVAGEYDSVVPIRAMRALHKTACAARGPRCEGSVRFIKAKEAKHRFEDIFWPARSVIIDLAVKGKI